jgi:CHAT domain-containing protein/tetratricopeptide (TPR) repeat protein
LIRSPGREKKDFSLQNRISKEKLVLTRPPDQHLDGDELDALAMQFSGIPIAGQLSENAIQEIQQHLDSCQDCDRKVQMHRSVQSAISRLAMSGQTPKGPRCSDEIEWMRLAAGELDETEAKGLMQHASQCRHCGPLLKAAVKTLSDVPTPDEEAALAKLRSARQDWQAKMARTLRNVTKDPWRESAPAFWERLFSWPRPAFAAVAAAVVITAVWIGLRALRPPTVEQLLAQAYTQRRSMEVRIPAAEYAPMRVERNNANSNFNKPPQLLKAEVLISERLAAAPNDPAWLDNRARAELLDGNYDDAVKTLLRGLESQPDSRELLTDLGSAYYQRAKSSDRPIDYSNAIEVLGKVLAKNPDDRIALFNRALACEQIYLYTQAMNDWEQYLRIDPHGEWAEEARRRLQAIQEKTNQHKQSMAEPLLTPSQIVEVNANQGETSDLVDRRIEEYIHEAISKWLPEAFPMAGPPRRDTNNALSLLSTVMIARHSDWWLADLLNQAKGARFPTGIRSLAEALNADDAGDYSTGRKAAQRAALILGSAGNRAAELRAIAEQVYADHLSWESGECISLVQKLSAPLQNSRYWWLRAQMSFEHSNCANQTGDMGTYLSAITDGLRLAKVHRYTPLYLRGLGFEALALASIGNVAQGFSLVVEGLEVFWSDRVEVMKGYNFYSHLDAMANELGLSHFQVLVCLEGALLLDSGPNLLRRAMAHSFAGKAAYLADNPDIAVSEFSKARELFAEAPQNPATIRDHLDAEVWVANAEIRRGDLRKSEDILGAIKPTLFEAPSLDPEIEYYIAAANLGIRKPSAEDLEPTLRSALALAEWSLKTFHDEQGRQTWTEQSRDAYRDVVEWKLRQGDSMSSLELWEWYKGAEIRAAESNRAERRTEEAGAPTDPRNAPPIPTPTAIAELLPSLHDQTLVAFATFYDGIAIWLYDDRGVFSTWVGVPPERVAEQAVALRQLCFDSSSNLADLRTTAHSLYDLLLHPIEERLDPNRTLILEPDNGFLAAIPWEVLLDSDGRYLVQRSPTVISPGAYWLMRRGQAGAITSTTPALVVTVPSSPAESLVPLTEADREGQMVAETFTHSMWLRGSDATVSSIRAGLNSKGVFHFVGHAIASSQRSGLVLAEIDPAINRSKLLTGQSLRTAEISALQLAVLSACPTDFEGRSPETAERGLPDTFLRAGVPHVVASRWNVDSVQTSAFMGHFYKRLLEGEGVAESIRSARLALASQPASAHPYYWSAFELEGMH